MGKLIDADLAAKAFERLKHDKEYSDIEERYDCGIDACIDEIREIEPIDAKPVVHAHWIEFRANNGNVHCKCSRCGKEVSYSYAKKRWKYCIECGAKMDEEETAD